MIRRIRMNNMNDGAAIGELATHIFNPLGDTCIAWLTSSGKFAAGVVYTSYTGEGGSVTMHVGSTIPRWGSRDMLWVCFDYPFNQMRVNKVLGLVSSANEKALRFDLNLGFKHEATVKDAYPGGDMLVMSMYREDCRFLKLTPRTMEKPDGR